MTENSSRSSHSKSPSYFGADTAQTHGRRHLRTSELMELEGRSDATQVWACEKDPSDPDHPPPLVTEPLSPDSSPESRLSCLPETDTAIHLKDKRTPASEHAKHLLADSAPGTPQIEKLKQNKPSPLS